MNQDTSTPHTVKRDRVLWGIPIAAHAGAWIAFILVSLILVAVYMQYREVNVWENWRESGGLRKPSYAERIYEQSVLRTRANTWSNLAYVLVGFYAIALAWHDRRVAANPDHGYLRGTPGLSLLFGLGCCLLGIGSGLFHASLTRWGQQLDVASMYAPLLALIAINAGRYFPTFRAGRMPTWPFFAAAAIGFCTYLYVYKWQMSSFQVLSSLILTTAAFVVLDVVARRRARFRWVGLALLALVLAVVCRQTDVRGQFTNPDAWLQGHALWHVFTAVSLAAMYAYLRSERPIPRV